MTKKKEDVAVDTEATEDVNVDIAPVQLTLQDLQSLLNVVDLAASRGAFRGQDMTSVGAVYNKLSGFLQYIASTQEPEAEESAEPAKAE